MKTVVVLKSYATKPCSAVIIIRPICCFFELSVLSISRLAVVMTYRKNAYLKKLSKFSNPYNSFDRQDKFDNFRVLSIDCKQ